MRSDTDRAVEAVRLFGRHLERLAIGHAGGLPRRPGQSPGLEALTIADQEVLVQTRTLPAVADRILEVLSLHVVRSRERSGPERMMIISVPNLPVSPSWLDEIKGVQKGDLKRGNWAVVSDGGGAVLHLP